MGASAPAYAAGTVLIHEGRRTPGLRLCRGARGGMGPGGPAGPRAWGALRDGCGPRAPILGFGAGPDGAGDPRSLTAPGGHGDRQGTGRAQTWLA